MNLLRREFGIGEPVRRGMELKIVRQSEWAPAILGAGSKVGEDILKGRDCEIGWEDVYKGDGDGMGERGEGVGGLQAELDGFVGLGKW